MKTSERMPASFIDLAPELADFRSEVLGGLRQAPKTLSPKFFYDGQGCRLFEGICELPEYYLTRTEIGILDRHAPKIVAQLGSPVTLIELGSGSSRKIRLLLDALRPRRYIPLDIARAHVFESASSIAADYPWLEVTAVCVDYSRAFDFPNIADGSRRIAFFPGSSIGNFPPDSAVSLLRSVAELVGPDGGLLIGYDLQKDPAILHRAYNDAEGLTAAFNLNLLRRINRELGGGFDLTLFRHRAHFDESESRIEMHLVSLARQSVAVSDQVFEFEADESIHTENAYKYTIESFAALAAAAGFSPLHTWTDPQQYFCVQLLGTTGSVPPLHPDGQ